jgi:hypothetical protein
VLSSGIIRNWASSLSPVVAAVAVGADADSTLFSAVASAVERKLRTTFVTEYAVPSLTILYWLLLASSNFLSTTRGFSWTILPITESWSTSPSITIPILSVLLQDMADQIAFVQPLHTQGGRNWAFGPDFDENGMSKPSKGERF